jgi:hypothetical protein
MRSKLVSLAVAVLLLVACGRQATESDGNGTGNADGLGGRQDPTTAPASQGDKAQPSDEAAASEPQSGSQ